MTTADQEASSYLTESCVECVNRAVFETRHGLLCPKHAREKLGRDTVSQAAPADTPGLGPVQPRHQRAAGDPSP